MSQPEPRFADKRYVLPDDIVLSPVERLSSASRSATRFGDGDMIIGRPRVRSQAKILSADTASLIEFFRTPARIHEVVAEYATRESADPIETLKTVYPILRSLIDEKLIAVAGSADVRPFKASVEMGEHIQGFRIVRCIQVLEDTEVYLGRSRDRTAAIKIARVNAHQDVRTSIVSEQDILAGLDGVVNPALLDGGHYADLPFLIVEWCTGQTADFAASSHRVAGSGGRPHELLELCRSIASAYAHLHSQDVVHGDVHPRNVIVGSTGEVRIIDFGAAAGFKAGNPAQADGSPRPGAALYFEPEAASAALTVEPSVAPSYAGEQYALAALLYGLICGEPYIEANLDLADLFRQIVHTPPIPLHRRGLHGWREVEQCLFVALSKSPGDRYSSVADFSRALDTAELAVDDRTGVGIRLLRPSRSTFVRKFIDRVKSARTCASDLKVDGPSVAHGQGGIAYALYRFSVLRGDPDLFALADILASSICDPDTTLCPPDRRSLDRHSPDSPPTRSSVYLGAAGIPVVRALIASAADDSAALVKELVGFIRSTRLGGGENDLFFGSAGALVAAAQLADALPVRDGATRKMLAEHAASLMNDLQEHCAAAPAIGVNADVLPLGMAHGWVGLLYAALRWHSTNRSVPPDWLLDRLDQLAALGERNGRGVRWEWRTSGESADALPPVYTPGWCNGSSGFVQLWTIAHASCGTDKFAELAEGAAWDVWTSLHDSPVNLCCGAAGRAYALLNVGNHFGDDTWTRRAAILADHAFREADKGHLDDSLYSGMAGLAVLAADLEDPSSAFMPFFEDAR